MTSMGQYEQIMDRIEVTEEMRARILQNIQNVDWEKPAKVTRFPKYKKYLSIAACLAVLLIGALAIPNLLEQSVRPNPPDVAVPNIVECLSIEELEDKVGFDVEEVDTLPFDVEIRAYTAYWDELAQIKYTGDGQTAVFRKSEGSEDNSGDFGVYNAVDEITVGATTVTLKGNDGQYTLAVWSEEGFSYSMNLSQGIEKNEWNSVIAGSFLIEDWTSEPNR